MHINAQQRRRVLHSMECVTLVQLNIKCATTWIMVGVITHTAASTDSYQNPGCYAWAGSNQVYIAGSNRSGHEGWVGLQSGDRIVLKLDRDANLMNMKISRLASRFQPILYTYVWTCMVQARFEVEIVEPEPDLIYKKNKAQTERRYPIWLKCKLSA